MEDIKVGEYVRTNEGIIAKVTFIDCCMLDTDNDVFDLGNKYYVSKIPVDYIKERVKKHSSDILDLIEVRDFINGLKILDLERKEDRIFACIAKIGPKEIWRTFYKEDIIDIVTKEQFEHEKYIVGGQNK